MLDLDEQGPLSWSKARASAPVTMCVEVAAHPEGVALRHSKAPWEGALLYSRAEFAAFVDGVKRGEFDHLVDLPAPRGASSDS